MPLLRREIGDVLRSARQQQGRTLREVSGAARVSLGYLSEVERGQKEASSELLSSICNALEVPMSTVLRAVSDRVAAVEGAAVGVRPGVAASAAPVLTAPAAPVLAGFDVPETTAPALPVGDLGIKQVVITRDGLVSAA
ncbi:helix-turn-helix transcriptional regulator [Quadrisphaera sp. INWT6]|uniref:helix-turn-helix domain-containing protein n=1 Tax=Quadrisphaera sp. INWT6 TaxID=2596917 RepID=UPI0018924A39|nr:helix-turn-helix transcriptional regulator [Quadrisphaera sp. INWT6]